MRERRSRIQLKYGDECGEPGGNAYPALRQGGDIRVSRIRTSQPGVDGTGALQSRVGL